MRSFYNLETLPFDGFLQKMSGIAFPSPTHQAPHLIPRELFQVTWELMYHHYRAVLSGVLQKAAFISGHCLSFIVMVGATPRVLRL